MKQRSNRKRAEGSVTLTCASEERKSVFASTVKPKSLDVLGAGDLNNPRHYPDEVLVAAAQNGISPALGALLTRHRHFVRHCAADDGHH